MEYKLSFLIPANSEMFLARTIQDILDNTSEQSEIIIVLDGKWADPQITQHPRVNIIYVPETIGQRAATNLACKLSCAKYVVKVDAHCSFDKDWDLKMFEAFEKTGDNVTMVSTMRNLHVFDWKCRRCKWTKYQGPTPQRCGGCNDSRYIVRNMIWQPRRGIHSTSYCFDSEPHFQYFEDWKHRPQYEKDKKERGLTETMSLQGSCFMATREKYWELDLCGEEFGSWGNQGLEVACKTWLSGGKVLVNHKTWYAHMFRTQGGDFGFPYIQSGNEVIRCKKKVKDMFWNNKYEKAIYPLNWLIEKFWPIPGWNEKTLNELKK